MESKTQVRKTVVRKETEFIADGCDGLLDLLQVFVVKAHRVVVFSVFMHADKRKN